MLGHLHRRRGRRASPIAAARGGEGCPSTGEKSITAPNPATEWWLSIGPMRVPAWGGTGRSPSPFCCWKARSHPSFELLSPFQPAASSLGGCGG